MVQADANVVSVKSMKSEDFILRPRLSTGLPTVRCQDQAAQMSMHSDLFTLGHSSRHRVCCESRGCAGRHSLAGR